MRTTLVWLVATYCTQAVAFQINPNQAENDAQRAALASYWERLTVGLSERLVGHFKSPNHETITHKAFGCTATNALECAGERPETRAPDAAIWGVRWNDDPPFRMHPARAACRYDQTIRLNTQPKCWYELFKDAEQRAAAGDRFGPGDALLYRSHFGDLQFLHSMASEDGEPAELTRANVLRWAEFTWRTATGQLPQNKFLRELGVAGLETYFPGDQTSAVLFALGNPPVQRRSDLVALAALGSLLHVVQDSMAKAHVERAEPTGADCVGLPGVPQPGKIVRFQNYAGQDSSKHDEEDSINALNRNLLEMQPSVVDVSKSIVDLWKTKAEWTVVQPYLSCVFTLDDSVQPAGTSDAFRRN